MLPIQPAGGAPQGTVGYFSTPKQKVPPWAKALSPIFPALSQAQNLSNRFVIFLPVESRWFAVCFGYGSSALEWSAIEANFGLRFAARRMSPKSLREFRSRRVGASNRAQAVQLPLGGDLKDLDVGALEGEFVRRLAGTLDESNGAQFADVDAVAATDAISFRARTDLEKIQGTLSRMLAEIEAGTAAEGLKFVDSLEPLRVKSEQTAQLDRHLAQALFGGVHGFAEFDDELSGLQDHLLEFSFPDILTTDEIDEIRLYRGERSTLLSEPSIAGVRDALNELKGRLPARSLDNIKLMAFDNEGEAKSPYMPLRHWLIFESGNEERRFILTLGRWFALNEAYTRKLDDDLSRVDDLTDVLKPPAWEGGKAEGAYNDDFRKAHSDTTIILDKVKIRSEDGDEIEACDLLHRDGFLIHVKNYKKSQTLSHLFSQGLVSALSLRGDSVYRDNFLRAVQGIDPAFVPIAEKAPEVVVYAIGVQKDRPVPLGLPSFSKVNLRDFVKRVRGTGARPAICRIQITDSAGSPEPSDDVQTVPAGQAAISSPRPPAPRKAEDGTHPSQT
ncbi:sporadically distributed protein, TIGR04141 family [Micromonospora aurantiaca]|nr:sporadically distributed protein, TIGR04141 family [Micromonospora aurantiaca]